MSLEPRKNNIILTPEGVDYKGMTFEYPIRIGKLENYRGFKDLTLELTRDGRQYFILIYEKHKGLISKAKISKLNAYYALKGLLSKAGFSNEPMSQKEFEKLFKSLAVVYVGD